VDPHSQDEINESSAQGLIKLKAVENPAATDRSKVSYSEHEEDGAAGDIHIPEESKVGKKLSDLTTRRVIILVLAMLLSVPIFTVSTYIPELNSFQFGLTLLSRYENNTAGFNFVFDKYVEEQRKIRTPIILLNAEGVIWQDDSVNPDDLRTSEKEIVSAKEGDYVSIYDLRKNTKLQAALSICITIFVCFILASGALLFSKEANDLVIAPIEQMIQKVNRIAANPLEAA